nr:CPBP family intramembrane glutamic endopeptidase [Latilactobacillus fuchuensis]
MVVIGLGSTIALNLIGQTTNGDVAGDQVTGLVGYLAVFLDNILSLFWEELISLIPLLAMMAGLKALGVSRKISIILSTIVTSILFGALHLPSYQWNVPMVFTSIVFLRLILDVLYLKTKNIWLTYVTHLLYDSFVFALPLIFGLIFKH